MILTELPLPGGFLVETEKLADQRGYFARVFCVSEFRERGLDTSVEQCNLSFNDRRLTLRGMHYQAAPHAESKLVRCTRGAIFDVAVDLRRDSPTYLRWYGTELSADNAHALYLPEGMAHGFLTLEDGSEVLYQMSAPYVASAARGVRWDDPVFGIAWPAPPEIISERDLQFGDYVP